MYSIYYTSYISSCIEISRKQLSHFILCGIIRPKGDKKRKEPYMKFWMVHNNLNVLELEKSLAFYKEALGLTPVREKEAQDGSYKLVFLGDGKSGHQLELTWLRDRNEPYNLGDNEIHLAFYTDDYNASHSLHERMGCICYENPKMGIYFIQDPDGYWLEIIPERKA